MNKTLLLGYVACMGLGTLQAQEADSLLTVNKMKELEEIVVKGGFPNTRLKGNSMVTRVEGTALASTGTADEMLIKVPGMTGTEEDPEVLGKGKPLIYLNGRLLRDKDELKRLPSSEVLDVEVINNPGAQYDATVRAVVRLRTVRKQGDGLSLNLSATDEQDLRYGFNNPNSRLNLNYRRGAVDVFGGVWYYHQDYRQYSSLREEAHTRHTFRQDGPYTMTWLNNSLTYTGGLNWQLSDHHSVGVRADLTHFLGGTNKVIYDEDVWQDDLLIDHLYSVQTSKESKPLAWLTNTYYSGQVGEWNIDFNFDFMNSEVNTDRKNLEKSQLQDATVLSRSGTKSELYAAKLVVSHPLWLGSLEGGTEMTFVRRQNDYWIDRPNIDNTDADIEEDNVAAFAEYHCPTGNWGSLNAGLRYEHTRFDYSDPLTQDYLQRRQDEWFPSASWAVMMGQVQTSLSYSVKTYRPSFFAMNDAVTYISRYSQQAGNSQLRNERLQDLTLDVSWQWLTLSASYERSKNAITQWSLVGDDDAVLIKHINLDKPYHTYSAMLSATPSVGFWSLNATLGIERQDLSLQLSDPTAEGGVRRATFHRPVCTANVFNTIQLPHRWRLDLNVMYRSHGHQMNFYNDYDKCRMGVVVQKSLLADNSLTLRLAVVDILQRNRVNEYGDMGNYQIWQCNRFSTHKLNMAVFYKFNAARSKYKGTGAGKEAQERVNG